MKDLGALLGGLARPLCVPDLETTGVVFAMDRIIQFGVTMFYPGGEAKSWKTFVDPEMPIPAEIQHRVKITDADVAGAPTFRSLAPALARKLTGVDFAGYNVEFDLKFMAEAFKREGVDWAWDDPGVAVIDGKAIFFKMKPRTLEDAYKEYVDPAGFEGAHDAGNDVAATVAVIAGQLERHAELPRTVAGLAAWCFPQSPENVDRRGKIVWRAHVACIGFGNKHNGTPLEAVAKKDRGYLSNFMLKGDFPADTKAIVEAALRGEFPKWVPRG